MNKYLCQTISQNRGIGARSGSTIDVLKECCEVFGQQGATSAGEAGGEARSVSHTMVGEQMLFSVGPRESE